MVYDICSVLHAFAARSAILEPLYKGVLEKGEDVMTCPARLHCPPRHHQQPPHNSLLIIIHRKSLIRLYKMVKDHDFLHQAIYGVSMDADDKKKPFFWNLPRVSGPLFLNAATFSFYVLILPVTRSL